MLPSILAWALSVTIQAAQPDVAAHAKEVVALLSAQNFAAVEAADAKSPATVSGAPASYWLDLPGYDPPSAAKALGARMLVLQGERDYQVTLPEFEQWKAALAGRASVTLRSHPALNHLFMAGKGPSVPAEYQVPGHVAEDVIHDIAAWIKWGSGL